MAPETIVEEVALPLSWRYLEDRVIQLLVNESRPMRTAELRVGLAELGIDLPVATIRHVLNAGARVTVVERQWQPCWRAQTGHRPLDGAIEDVLELVGRPLDLRALITEVAASQHRSPQALASVVVQLVTTRAKYAPMGERTYGLRKWLLDVSAGDEDLVVKENFLHRDPAFADALSAIEMLAGEVAEDDVSLCESTLDLVGRPVSNRLLTYVVWRLRSGDVDPLDLITCLLSSESLYLLSSDHWCNSSTLAMLADELARIEAEPSPEDEEEEIVAPESLDLLSVLSAKVPEERQVVLTVDDMARVHSHAVATGQPVDLVSALEEVLETNSAHKDFVPTAQALARCLEADDRFSRVGLGCWALRERVPAWVQEAPHGMEPEYVDIRTIENEVVDAVLDDAGLDAHLENAVRAPEWEDFGEEDEVVNVPPHRATGDELEIVVLNHHRRNGVLFIRSMDRGFWPPFPNVQCLRCYDEDDQLLPLWVCLDTGLIHGLGPLYEQRCHFSGSVLRIRKREGTYDEFEVRVSPEPHADTLIDEARFGELQALVRESVQQEMSTLDVMIELMRHHSAGASLLRLWAECNVVRRTSKRLVASNLSSYPCFHTRGKVDSSGLGLWGLDERNLDEGRRREKKKYIRRR